MVFDEASYLILSTLICYVRSIQEIQVRKDTQLLCWIPRDRILAAHKGNYYAASPKMRFLPPIETIIMLDPPRWDPFRQYRQLLYWIPQDGILAAYKRQLLRWIPQDGILAAHRGNYYAGYPKMGFFLSIDEIITLDPPRWDPYRP